MRRLSYNRNDLGFSFALTTFMMVVASLILQVFLGSSRSGWQFWVMQSLYTAMIGCSAFLYAAISQTRVFSATKLNKRPPISHILWGCGGVVCLVMCMNQINNLFLDTIESSGLNRPSVTLEDNLPALIICACVLPAFAEEIIFRGTIAQSLYNHKSKLAAVAISGALFSLFHGNPAQTLHQFVLGAFLTLLVFRSGSLWTTIIVHFFNNAFVVALSYTPLGHSKFWNLKTNTEWALPLMIVGIVGFAICVILYVKTTKSYWERTGVAKTPEKVLVEEGAGDNANDSVVEIPYEQYDAAEKRMANAPLLVGVFVCLVLWISQLLK